MRFAFNYSPESVALRNRGQIAVDLFKIPDWPDLITSASAEVPVYVHFSLRAGSPQPEPDWSLIERTLAETETQYVNLHLGTWAEAMPEHDLLDLSPAVAESITERIIADVQPFVTRFGADRVMGENLFALDRKGMVMQASTLPSVIATAINETGIGLLLDTAHAKMAAFTLGLPVQEYISALPVDRLRELHVTGIGYRDDGRLGDHRPMRPDDWALYEWALAQVHDNPAWGTPAVVACEYGGVGELFRPNSRAEVIAEEAPRMYRAVYRP